MAVVRRIVEGHGGTIDLGRISPGAEFRLRLPLEGQSVGLRICRRGAPTGRSPTRPGQSRDPDRRRPTQHAHHHRAGVAAQGYEVFEAESGEAALSRLLAEPFDVVLTDLKMAPLDGWPCCAVRWKSRPRRR